MSSPPKTDFGGFDHQANEQYARQWMDRFQALVFKYQDSLEGEAYDQRLLKKGRWYGSLLTHQSRPIAIHISFTPPPSAKTAPISFTVSMLQPSGVFRVELESQFVQIQREERRMS